MFLNGVFTPAMSVMDAVMTSQKTVSSNIANAQTPGYTAKSTDFSQVMFGLSNPLETRMAQKYGSSLAEMGTLDTGEPVKLQDELVQMQKNMLYYNMASRRLNSVITALKTSTQIGR